MRTARVLWLSVLGLAGMALLVTDVINIGGPAGALGRSVRRALLESSSTAARYVAAEVRGAGADAASTVHSRTLYTGPGAGLVGAPEAEGPALRILVLTMDRPKSLLRLLNSLLAANYGTDRIDLDVWVDRMDGADPHPETMDAVANFRWPTDLGSMTVHVWPENAGLSAQWTQTWNASLIAAGVAEGLTAQTPERAVILEDDLEVSEHYWTWLGAAHDAYDDRPDVAGVTLQRAQLCAAYCPDLAGGANAETTNFFYPVVGSWGYSPTARHWTRFNAWLRPFQESGESPAVSGIVPSTWYGSFEKAGRCPGKRCMWTMSHLKYTDTHEDSLTLYVNVPEKQTMAGNWRENGLHTAGGGGSTDFPLFDEWNDQVSDFPDQPTVLGYNGQPRTDYVHPTHRFHPGYGDQGSVTAPSSATSWPPGKHSQCAELHPDITLQTELYPEEKELFAKYAQGRTSYLEWGTGGSSDTFTRLIEGPVYSIENFPQWCQAVQETPYVACRIAEGSMSFHCIDTGPVAAYGNPSRKEDVPRFVDYVHGNEAFPNLLPTYDLIFDDGRSREAVAYQAYHHMDADSVLLVHDYPNRDDMERQYYRDIERYFDKVDGTSRLAVFRKRMDVNPPSQGMIEEQALTYHR